MLTSGDVIDLDLGVPDGHEAGFRHPAIVVTAQRLLDFEPSIIQIVPVTSTLRPYESEVRVEPDRRNGLDRPSVAQCQHVRGVSASRMSKVRGNVGPVVLAQLRDALADLFDVAA